MSNGKDFIVRIDPNHRIMEILDKYTSNKKAKRYRSAFTTKQLNYLEEQFKKFPYINNNQRKEIAKVLKITETAVKIWFQNRRMKEKRENTTIDDESNSNSTHKFSKYKFNKEVMTSANDQEPHSLNVWPKIGKAYDSKNIIVNNPSINSNATPMVTIPEFKVMDSNTGVHKTQSFSSFAKQCTPVQTNNQTADFIINSSKESFKCSSTVSSRSPEKHEDLKSTNYTVMDQMIPEDLSKYGKVLGSTSNPTQSENITTPNCSRYISMLPTVPPFYSQPYYTTTSGVLWKPVSVVPSVISNGASVSLPLSNNLSLPLTQDGISKKCCNCDCHDEALGPYYFQQQSSSPQYLITAVPFLNPSTT